MDTKNMVIKLANEYLEQEELQIKNFDRDNIQSLSYLYGDIFSQTLNLEEIKSRLDYLGDEEISEEVSDIIELLDEAGERVQGLTSLLMEELRDERAEIHEEEEEVEDEVAEELEEAIGEALEEGIEEEIVANCGYWGKKKCNCKENK